MYTVGRVKFNKILPVERVKQLNLNVFWKKKKQMYIASVNDADSDKRSENDMKYESIIGIK